MTLRSVIAQLNAITDGMFMGTVPFRSSNLNAAMKCHPANSFYGIYQPLEDALYDDEGEISVDDLREVYDALEEYRTDVNVKALTKPLKGLKTLIEKMERGEGIELSGE
ncbi:MAG: hypothetical protein PHP02_01590 [Eubacteriales bacterium]|nr:hypothetical protein [Eubacteriales bacterium]